MNKSLQFLQYGTCLFFTFENAEETPGGDKVFNVLQFRNPKSFSKETQNYLNLITIQEDVNPVGSQKFKVARYPGDIDLMETIEYCCSLNTATQKIAKSISKMAKLIDQTKKIYLGDFKAGLDDRYIRLKENLGEINEYSEIEGYDYKELKEITRCLREKRLITNQDFKEINDLLVDRISISKWTILYKFCRDFWIIRWSLNELIAGKKLMGLKIAEKKHIKLSEALKHRTVCKLDLWAPINNRYMEVTNFFLTSYMDKSGESIAISPPLGRYKEHIITDIKHYGDDDMGAYNPLKMAKRIWALAVSIGDQKTLKKIYPLFSSGASALYQIDAEIETIIFMLEKKSIEKKIKKDKTMRIIKDQIDGFKSRISDIYDMEIDEDLLFSMIDDIVESNQNYFIVKKLKQLTKIIFEYHKDGAETYLKNANLLNINKYDYLLED